MDPDPRLAARPRAVLLGASNLTRGLSTAVETARLVVGGPLDVLLACGHGRSYGTRSRVLGRSLPGIVGSGLWDALGRLRRGPTLGLITDVGNDIAYGAEPEAILEWVGTCLDRLVAGGAEVVITGLPLAPLRRISPARFRIVKAVLFPGRPIGFARAIARADRVHEGLAALADGCPQARFVETAEGWYGLDPIHIRMRCWPEAWARILAGRGAADEPDRIRARPSPARWLRLRTATPERWWLLGKHLGRAQPARRMPDGTAVWVF